MASSRTGRLDAVTDILEARIARRLKPYTDGIGDPRMREALLRIGFLLEAEVKLNIRRKHIINTGRLLNSIASIVEPGPRDGTSLVGVGSFGVPYAGFQEYGTRFMAARPYLRPAFQAQAGRIMGILRDLMRGAA